MGAITRVISGSTLIYIAIFGFYVPYVTGTLSLVSGVDLCPDVVNCHAADTSNLTWTITASVKNQGTDDAGQFDVVLSENLLGMAVPIATYTIPSLVSGKSVVCSPDAHAVFLAAGDYNITMSVDPKNQVNETDKTNNVGQFTITVVTSSGTSNGAPFTIPFLNFTFPQASDITAYIASMLEIPNTIIKNPVLKGILFIIGFYMLATGVATFIKKKDETA